MLGHQYGGVDNSYNLVPMLRASNRGGEWNALETAITTLTGFAIFALKCTYSPAYDTRIPCHIEAGLIPVDNPSGAILDAEWDRWVPSLRTMVRTASGNQLSTRLTAGLLPRCRSIPNATRQFSFTQSLFSVRQPYLPLVNPGAFENAFIVARQYVDSSGWRIERDGRAPFESAPNNPSPYLQFEPRYRLPDLIERRYAALDYMALTGQLDGQLAGGNNADHNITSNTIHNASTFNESMKSFAMYANLILHRNRMVGQRAYLSDAADHVMHPDLGTAGAGVVLEPEFDHSIPRNPAQGLPGPTIFSNLQITSPRYNSQKSNNLWIAPAVTVGRLRDIPQNTRGSAKRKGDFEPDEHRAKRFNQTVH